MDWCYPVKAPEEQLELGRLQPSLNLSLSAEDRFRLAADLVWVQDIGEQLIIGSLRRILDPFKVSLKSNARCEIGNQQSTELER